MFDADHYAQRVNEAQHRASIAPTEETRLSWQSIQQGWEAIIRIQNDILNGKARKTLTDISAAPSLVPAQKPVPLRLVKGG
jgi:hypothetical protein